MKIGAHPLVVAVALGFLNPAALASEMSDAEPEALCDDPQTKPCADCTCTSYDDDQLDVAAIEDAWTSLVR